MISIIGAGPAGSFAGYLLAKQGFNVNIFEEHKEIGSPVQCTGLVTGSINSIINVDKCTINKINKVRIYAPNNKYIEINFKKSNLLLDRKKFDQLLAEKAKRAGAHITTKKITSLDLDSKYIIGADGPLSIVSKYLNNKRKYWAGLQYLIKHKNDNAIEFYPYIGTFAWIVPENKTTVRVGIVGEKNIKNILDKFVKDKIGNKKPIATHAGLIPKFNPKIKLQKNNRFIIGDAASLVKATTAGGIIQSLESAQVLADSIIKKKNYSKGLKKKMYKDLLIHNYIRKVLDKFSQKDWNRLVSYFNNPKMKKILETNDRDYPHKMMVKLILTNPKLIYFLKFLL